ncbi:hypothetical protein DFA_01846 [Cavenderia fasciculata]|uniref:FAD-binding domain-containing protein n=1 Tax=Cavenderia fasciculata TaxID=261658 RepID=F4PV52_CACFS|nr:uncharacterized protein DFA_01846 [Cavenderia fasciculata]EGG21960.1 hypothetical protein DFA_01846 [Cavenderia fasciculata]|eukprot:XP_004359811.1 hypothetical protein DFA_01846 [Cavenderia fasciculata]
MKRMKEEHVKVLVVGSGIVGLTTSLLLHQQQQQEKEKDSDDIESSSTSSSSLSTSSSITFKVIEKHSTLCMHPRSRGFNTRSMEIIRSLGLESKVKETVDQSVIQSTGIYSGRTLVQAIGRKYRWLRNPQLLGGLAVLVSIFGAIYWVLPGGWFSIFMIALVYVLMQVAKKWKRYIKESSTSSFTRITQDIIEPLLYESAKSRGIDIEFNQEMLELTKMDDSDRDDNTKGRYRVLVKDRVTGDEKVIWTDYRAGWDRVPRSRRDDPTTQHLLSIKSDGSVGVVEPAVHVLGRE